MKNREKDIEFERLYDELIDIVDNPMGIRRWYDIDKIKTYSVYVWTKDDAKLNAHMNVFDIDADELCFYVEEHIVFEDAKPDIKIIQDQLLKMKKVYGRE